MYCVHTAGHGGSVNGLTVGGLCLSPGADKGHGALADSRSGAGPPAADPPADRLRPRRPGC